ncbi:hypothetical protein LYSHEL_27220 [Lysobacter helvus]|uniref:Uncharacterized protein n=2 Tax=Lysobacteraceae TaxID=32033 RepID=A0ABN6FVK4_9GAMM|nr:MULTISPECIES: hypothetical protein [Lysobacter]BCT93695.1 hypothetical protein LYSCAS_27190 [Lysobacter caseinilyticus]BCT96851.1 hypothetical protein LYSHEL_27220 [Lysobacter helvus]
MNVRFLFAGLLLATSASAGVPSVKSSYVSASRAGVGRVVEADEVSRAGLPAVFVYRIASRQGSNLRICTGERFAVGSPVLFVIEKANKSNACPSDATFVPVESMRTFVLEGVSSPLHRRIAIRANYPQSVALGCPHMKLVSVSSTARDIATRRTIDSFPLSDPGTYFYLDDFMQCVGRK